ncbi:MAG: hypothetical protein DHS20C14_20370 [Phycisphaeraceae bacterium]|nr:MAG: hypothetical protein DHS20C14_20370 [Phycisphaeraceae bacterium]
MTTLLTKASWRLAGAALACAAGATMAAPIERLLVDRSLEAREVSILAISTDEIEIAHPDRTSEPIPMSDIAVILPIEQAPRSAHPQSTMAPGTVRVAVTMTDGQRVIGALGLGALDAVPDPALAIEDALLVRLPGADRVAIALDRIAHIELADAPRTSPAIADTDTVTLRNGDVITGYVLAVGSDVEIETDTDEVILSVSTVSTIALANPARTPGRTLVSLANGSVLEASRITTTPRGTVKLALTLTGGDEPAGSESAEAPPVLAFTLEEVTGLVPAGSGVLALASLDAPTHAPTGERRWASPPIAGPLGVGGLATIEFPGPMTATWPLPRGATRFATVATLGTVPGAWADCMLEVRAQTGAGPVELSTHRLHAASPTADIRVELPAGATAITLAVLPGARGPVHDRVFFERPMLLIER